MAVEAVVLQRQQRIVPHQSLAVGVHEVVERAAGLDAGSAVGAALGEVFAQETFSAVAYAEGSGNEELQLAADGLADGPYLLQRQLPLQHQPLEPENFQSGGLLRSAAYSLGGGVHLGAPEILLQQTVVLHQDGVHPGCAELPHQSSGLRQFVVVEQCVYGSIDLRAEAVGVTGEGSNVLHGVSCGLARSE